MSSDNSSLIYAVLSNAVHLVIHVFGNPLPQANDITWYHNNTMITNQDGLILSDDRTELTIENIGIQQYGVYRCMVTTSAGTNNQSFTIKRCRESMKLLFECYIDYSILVFSLIVNSSPYSSYQIKPVEIILLGFSVL